MQRKPKDEKSDNLDSFIHGAKDTKLNEKPAPVINDEPKSNDVFSLESLLADKPKTFPINMPPVLHKLAAEKAASSFPKMSLHDFILVAIKEKIERT